jgi:hypothetical protein
MKLHLGNILWSTDLQHLMSNDIYFAKFVVDSLIRHSNGEWGNDNRMNESAIKRHGNIWSIFKKDDQPEILIITESAHFSTTVRFPDDCISRF